MIIKVTPAMITMTGVEFATKYAGQMITWTGTLLIFEAISATSAYFGVAPTLDPAMMFADNYDFHVRVGINQLAAKDETWILQPTASQQRFFANKRYPIITVIGQVCGIDEEREVVLVDAVTVINTERWISD